MSILFGGAAGDYATYTGGTLDTATGHPVTIMAWVYRNNLVDAECMVQYGAGGGSNNNSISLRTTTTAQASVRITDTTNTTQSTVATALESAWHHYAGVFNTTSSRTAYLDGSASNENTVSKSITASFDELIVGKEFGSNSFNYTGYLAHVALWKSVLSGAQISSLAAGANPQTIDAANLIAYYPMTSSGNVGEDIIGGYNLTLAGTTAYDSNNPTVDAYSTYKSRLMLLGIG